MSPLSSLPDLALIQRRLHAEDRTAAELTIIGDKLLAEVERLNGVVDRLRSEAAGLQRVVDSAAPTIAAQETRIVALEAERDAHAAHVRRIAEGAQTVTLRHPGCGAVAGLNYALAQLPASLRPHVPAYVMPHPEDDNDDAAQELRELRKRVRDLEAQLADADAVSVAELLALRERADGLESTARELERRATGFRARVLREAADEIGSDDTCTCGGCDSCAVRGAADELRRMADAAERGGPR